MKIQRSWWILLLSVLFLFAGTLTSAVTLENQDSFCASCHTEPESTYFHRSQSKPSDLASAHSQFNSTTRCIDCHSGLGANGRINSLKQGSVDLTAFIFGDYHQPAVTINPVGDQGCTKCHTNQDIDFTQPNASLVSTSRSHYHLNVYIEEWLSRQPNQSGSCAICHTAHVQGDPSLLFMEFTPTKDICEDCHISLSGWIPPKP